LKRYITLIAVIIFSLLSFSCKEDFSPKTDFKEKYVLNCYVDLDYDRYKDTQVYATVSKLYDVNGFNPSSNNIDLAVSGAEIYFHYRDIIYQLKEDTNKAVITKYGTNQIYYYDSLRYIYPNYEVSVSAKMPDGTVLSAQTRLLEAVQLKYSYLFRRYFTTFINRFYFGDAFTITWGNINNNLFIPRLIIPCFKPDSTGKNIRYNKEIPCYYIKENGNYNPVYPIPTTNGSISFNYSAIDSAMSELSRESIDKGSVGYIEFQLVEFDSQLSKYYQSINGSLDHYSIRLDESVYSNIKNGLGIFGSKRTITNQWYLDSTYARSFGYSW
jgi:hypothetical protein